MAIGQLSKVIEHLRNTVLLQDRVGMTDGQLLHSYLTQRDEAALTALVRRHGPMVWGVCRRVLHRHHDAEDAFQATFLVLVRKAASVVPREMVANWLYGVAHQTALKARATAAKRKERERQVTEMPQPAVAEHDLWHDLRPLLDQELSRLHDKYRVVVVLCDLEGKTRKEAAQQLGVPEGTVAGRLARARAMLAKRLTRKGLAWTGGSLALVLSKNAASACVPTSLVVSTVKAASVVAVGQAVAGGVISAQVAALTEGVVRAMLITKLKITATVLLMVALAGLGGSALTHRVLAEKPANAEPSAARAGQRNSEGPATISAKVAGASQDGKTITLEMPPQARGEEPKRIDIRLTDKTEIIYNAVGLNGARPTEGYHAYVWLQQGSADTAAKVNFLRLSGPDHALGGKVTAVSKDGKSITVETPPGRGEQEGRKIEIKLTDKTTVNYSYAAKDAAKPTEGYQAQVWLQERGGDTAARVDFLDVNREKEFVVTGEVVGISKDGLTLKMLPKTRGGEPEKTDIKLTISTEITFHGVGPDGAKLTEGYGARVWLQEGAAATASRIMLFTGPRR